jgi:hypothetical protein
MHPLSVPTSPRISATEPAPPPQGLAPQTQRVLLRFLRGRLLPRDRVALFAYNRATAFTTDHEQIAHVVERFKQANDAIKSQIDWEMDGLAGLYGSQELSDAAQAMIDRVFEGTGASPYATAGDEGTARGRIKRNARQRVEDALAGVVATGRAAPVVEAGGEPAVAAPASWGAFDAFVAENAQTMRETGNLYAALAYMRRIEGEKHLVYVSPGGVTVLPPPHGPTPPGLHLLHTEEYTEIARAAADARVALDIIAGADNANENRLMRSLADETGGLASIG